ncbi:DUF3238 domain-containing protein, partial [Microcystis aeruginosa]
RQFYKIEPLLGEIDNLAAKSSLTIPVRITRIADFDILPNSAGELSTLATPSVPCSISGSLGWSYPCGGNDVQKSTTIAFNNVEGNCAGGGGGGGGGFSGGGGGSGGSGGSGGTIFSSVPIVYSQKTPCCEKDLDTFNIEVQAFIPYDKIDAPVPIQLLTDYYQFGGDGGNRGFSQDKSRTRMWSEVRVSSDGCKAPNVLSQRHGINPTTAYDKNGNLVAIKTATDPISESVTGSASTIIVNLNAAVGNPLVPAPKADYNFNLTLNRLRNEWQWQLNGSHDGFPAYGVFLNGELIYAHDPRITGEDPWSLFGSGEHPVSKFGAIKNNNPPPCCDTTSSSSSEITPQQNQQNSVCAAVKLQIDQEAVMTRAAFLGNLEIENGNPTNLTNLSVILQIKDQNGNIVNDKFGITNPILSNITAVDGTGILTGDNPDTPQKEGIGSAQWTFIP